MTGKAEVTLNDEDLRDLFPLFSSPTDEELRRTRRTQISTNSKILRQSAL